MQDRIKLPLHPDACSVDGWSTDEQRVLREFAQAVARECSEICRELANTDAHDYNEVRSDCAQAIRARFGLGE